MKYIGMPLGMWALFAGSFRRQLTVVFGYDAAAAKEIMKRAKPQYRKLAAYGHMGREDLGVAWERKDKVDALKAAVAKFQ